MDFGADVERRRFSADEVQQMVTAGILDPDEPLELIDGELFMMSPQSPSHRNLTVRVRKMLEQAYGPTVHVQDHSSIALAPNSLPEPDIAVVRGSERDYTDRLPNGHDLVLLVEIAVTSLARDRAKAKLYARGASPNTGSSTSTIARCIATAGLQRTATGSRWCLATANNSRCQAQPSSGTCATC